MVQGISMSILVAYLLLLETYKPNYRRQKYIMTLIKTRWKGQEEIC